MKYSNKFLAIALGICLAVAIFFLLGNYLLSRKIEQKIRQNEPAGFQLKHVEVESNVLTGEINLENIELVDSAGDSHIQIPNIRVKGIKLLAILTKNIIALKKVMVVNPSVTLAFTNEKSSANKKMDNTKSKQAFRIGEFQVDNAQITLLKKNNANVDTVFSTSLGIGIDEIRNTKRPQPYMFKDLSFKNLTLNLTHGNYRFKNKLYAFEYDTLRFNSEDNELRVQQAHILTRYGRYDVAHVYGSQIDYLDILIPEFKLARIQLNDLLNGRALIFKKTRIMDMQVDAFRDKRLPFPDKPDTKLIMQMIRELPIPLHIDSVQIENATIAYAERVEKSDDEGMVKFHKVQANLSCLSVIDSLITQKTTMHAEALVMGKGHLTVDFVFPNPKFPVSNYVSGRLGPMKIGNFNSVLVENASIRVKTGMVKQVAFNFTYNNDHSQGDLAFEYNSLEVEILKKKDNSNKKIQSFLTNKLILHDENIRGTNSYRAGIISFERDKKKSIFNYWWKSILSGIKSIAIL